jgi:hypothetical protein
MVDELDVSGVVAIWGSGSWLLCFGQIGCDGTTAPEAAQPWQTPFGHRIFSAERERERVELCFRRSATGRTRWQSIVNHC